MSPPDSFATTGVSQPYWTGFGDLENVLKWTPDQQLRGYRNIDRIYPTRPIARSARPFPLPLTAARELFMPMFVLAELRLGADRSQQKAESNATVNQLLARCRVINADPDTIPFYIQVRNELAKVRTLPQSLEKREGFGHDPVHRQERRVVGHEGCAEGQQRENGENRQDLAGQSESTDGTRRGGSGRCHCFV